LAFERNKKNSKRQEHNKESAVSRSKKRRRYPFLPPAFTEEIQPKQTYGDSQLAAILHLKSWKTLAVWRARGTHPFVQQVKPVRGISPPIYLGEHILAFLNGEQPRAQRRAR
jgi:hypothetical protein